MRSLHATLAVVALVVASVAVASAAFTVSEVALGDAQNDQIGQACAIDNSIGVCTSRTSQVFKVFNHDGSAWTEVHQESQPAGATDVSVNWGYSVAVANGRIVVGAPVDGDVYVYDASTYALLQTIDTAITNYGASLGADGDNLIVGSPDQNRVYFLSWDGSSNTYVDVNSIHINNIAKVSPDTICFGGCNSGGGIKFGSAVDISGDVAIVGAYLGGHYDPPNEADWGGGAWIYRDPMTGLWGNGAEIPVERTRAMYYGTSVAIHDNHCAICGIGTTSRSKGQCYIFYFDGTNWVNRNGVERGIAGQQFGSSADLDGGFLIVGSPRYWGNSDGTMPNAGVVYIFELDAADSGATQLVSTFSPTKAAGNYFGWSVAIESGPAGEISLASEIQDDQAAPHAGAVYSFEQAPEFVPCNPTGAGDAGLATTAATADIVPGSLDVTPAGQVVFSLALNDLPGVDGNSLSLAWGSAAVDPDDVIPSCDAGTASTYAVAVDFAFMVANSHSVDENVPNDASQTDDSQPDTVTAFDRYTSIVEATWTENSVEPRSGTAVTRTVSQPFVLVVYVPVAFDIAESDFYAFGTAEADIYVTLQDATISSVDAIDGTGEVSYDAASAAVVIEFSTLVQLPYRVDESSFAYTGAETVVSVSEDCDATTLVDGTDTTAFCTQSWSLTVTNAADTSVCSFAGDYDFTFQITCEGSAIGGQDNCPLGANDPTAASTLTVTLADADACASFATVDAVTSISVETRDAACTADRDSFVDTESVCFWAQATSDLPIASVEITQVSDGTTTGNDNSGSSAGNTDTNVIAISVFGSSAADSWFTTTFTYTVEVSYVGGARRRTMLQAAGAESLTASKTVAILPSGAAAGDAAATTNNVAAAGSASSTATIALLAGVGVAVVAAGAGVAVAVKSRREVAAVQAAAVAVVVKAPVAKAVDVAASDASSSSSFVELSSSELIEFSSASA